MSSCIDRTVDPTSALLDFCCHQFQLLFRCLFKNIVQGIETNLDQLAIVICQKIAVRTKETIDKETVLFHVPESRNDWLTN